jgi:hypothetical protein
MAGQGQSSTVREGRWNDLSRETAGGLRASSSIKSAGNDHKLEQRAAQISDLQASCADKTREHDGPDRLTLSEPDSGTCKKTKQYHWKEHEYSEPEAERGPDTQHR